MRTLKLQSEFLTNVDMNVPLFLTVYAKDFKSLTHAYDYLPFNASFIGIHWHDENRIKASRMTFLK